MRFQGLAYRAHNPKWAWDPLSGEGAFLHGGRFNRKGVAALYLSLDPQTAIREVQPLRRPMQPVVLCAYEVDVEPIFDSLVSRNCRDAGISDSEITSPNWRLEMNSGLIPASQQLADKLMETGFTGLRFRSFAAGAAGNDLNLVLWRWSSRRPVKVLLIDDEERLSQ